MKDLKKLIVLLLVGVMAFSLAACQNGEENEGGNTQPTNPPYKDTTSGLSDTQLSNYYLKFNATETVTLTDEEGNYITDENGAYVTEEQTTTYVEVGYSGLYLLSEDGGESFNVVGTSSFGVSSQTSIFGTFSSHKQYEASGTELENRGTETIANLETTHYYYKSGPMEIEMYVNADYDVCLKYSKKGIGAMEMEVQELQFGIVGQDGYKFEDFYAKIATPAPTEVPEEPAA